MKFLLLGDSHFNDRRPERRLDKDYFGTMMGKFRQAVEIYKKHECDVFIQPGDFSDSYRLCRDVTSVITEYLREVGVVVFCVWGQHDVSGHSITTFKNSPLRTLEAAGVVVMLGKEPEEWVSPIRSVYFYGASFGQKVPKPVDDNAFNVLVVHQMIGDKELYPGQDLQHPRAFLRRHKGYNLIVCGDYHYRFIEENKGRYCVNPGAMVRKSIAKRDLEHKPAVIIFDTEDRTCEVIELKIEPAEVIFDTSRTKAKEEEDYGTLLKFLENLKKSQGTTVGWKEILVHLFEELKSGKDVKEAIENCILEVEK